jgi:hypothetical protein
MENIERQHKIAPRLYALHGRFDEYGPSERE